MQASVADQPDRLDSPMLITCHNCATSYQVDPSTLGPAGRSVRCVRCGHVWFAAHTAAVSAIAQAHRAEIGEWRGKSRHGAVGDPPAIPPAAATTESAAALG